MKKLITSLLLLAGLGASAQVKVGDNVTTLAPGSLFEMESTNKGLLLPRVALTNTTAILPVLGTHAQATGMAVYNTATAGDVTPGIYSNDGTKWVKAGASSASTALNVTANQTGNYTALATDDIILYTANAAGLLLTLPTSGIAVGKKIYVSNAGSQDIQLSPLPREISQQYLYGGTGTTLIYLGGTGAGSWSQQGGY